MINPKLKKDDRIVLLHMGDEASSVPPGTFGTVSSDVMTFDGMDHYNVKWDNGSRLTLIGKNHRTGKNVDLWDYAEKHQKKSDKLNEMDEFERNKKLIDNIDVFKHFNMKFLKNYLIMVKNSGIVNMLASGPYLYMGKSRIEHEFKYKDISNESEFEEVLENADRAQAEMINGVIKLLESEKKDVSMENINRYLSRYSNKVVENYIYLF